MARAMDVGGRTAKREDLHALDPRGIIYDINDNRRWHPPGQKYKLNLDRVVQYAKEFLDPKIGQLQPIVVRIAEGKKPKVVAGFHRQAAALMVVNGSPEHGIEPHPDFLIRAVVKDLNEAEAAVAAIRENKSREGTSAIDDSENLRALRNFGKADDEIRSILNVSQRWMGTLEKLLKLPDDLKMAVHSRLIPADMGAEMADMEKNDRKEVLEEALKNAKIPVEQATQGESASDVSPEVEAVLGRMALTTEAARKEVGKGKGKGKSGANGHSRKLTKALRTAMKNKKVSKGERVTLGRSEMRSFWQFVLEDEQANECEKMLAKGVLEHSDGKRGDQSLRNLFAKVLRTAPKE